jgi:hypothetical protein
MRELVPSLPKRCSYAMIDPSDHFRWLDNKLETACGLAVPYSASGWLLSLDYKLVRRSQLRNQARSLPKLAPESELHELRLIDGFRIISRTQKVRLRATTVSVEQIEPIFSHEAPLRYGAGPAKGLVSAEPVDYRHPRVGQIAIIHVATVCARCACVARKSRLLQNQAASWPR